MANGEHFISLILELKLKLDGNAGGPGSIPGARRQRRRPGTKKQNAWVPEMKIAGPGVPHAWVPQDPNGGVWQRRRWVTGC